MTISKRQFDLLNVMNIPLWVTKQPTITVVEKETAKAVNESKVGVSEIETTEIKSSEVKSSEVKNTKIELPQNNIEHSLTSIDLPLLAITPLFIDILLTLGLSIEDVSIEENTVNLGLINWQFSSAQTLGFSSNLLTTPTIEQLEKSSNLKRQLWQLLVKSELICR